MYKGNEIRVLLPRSRRRLVVACRRRSCDVTLSAGARWSQCRMMICSAPAVLQLQRLQQVRQQSLQSRHAPPAAPHLTVPTRRRHRYVIVEFLSPLSVRTGCSFSECRRPANPETTYFRRVSPTHPALTSAQQCCYVIIVNTKISTIQY